MVPMLEFAFEPNIFLRRGNIRRNRIENWHFPKAFFLLGEGEKGGEEGGGEKPYNKKKPLPKVFDGLHNA